MHRSHNAVKPDRPEVAHYSVDRSIVVLLALALLAPALSGCQDPNALAMKIGQAPDSALKMREVQTRKLPAPSHVAMLSDVTQTLQDLGFTVAESSAELGVVTGAKERDAQETGQVAGQIALAVVFALLGAPHNPTWDKDQSIHVTTTVAPADKQNDFAVRVSFDRYLWNNHGQLWKTELIQDPVIYQEFFSRLSKGRTISASAN